MISVIVSFSLLVIAQPMFVPIGLVKSLARTASLKVRSFPMAIAGLKMTASLAIQAERERLDAQRRALKLAPVPVPRNSASAASRRQITRVLVGGGG